MIYIYTHRQGVHIDTTLLGYNMVATVLLLPCRLRKNGRLDGQVSMVMMVTLGDMCTSYGT